MKKIVGLLIVIFVFAACKGQNQTIHGNLAVTGTLSVSLGTELGTVANLNEDTIEKYQFNAYGSSLITTGSQEVYGVLPNETSDTFVLIKTVTLMTGTSPSITIDPQKHTTFLSGSSTGLFSSAQPVTSTTTGDTDYFPANTYLLPSEKMWLETPTVTTAPDFLSVTVYIQRLNRSF